MTALPSRIVQLRAQGLSVHAIADELHLRTTYVAAVIDAQFRRDARFWRGPYRAYAARTLFSIRVQLDAELKIPPSRP
jgi:hypothetical protein